MKRGLHIKHPHGRVALAMKTLEWDFNIVCLRFKMSAALENGLFSKPKSSVIIVILKLNSVIAPAEWILILIQH